jgi:hypothetical protein
MLRAVRGRYKNGSVELFEKPPISEGNVIITFIDSEESDYVKLQSKGITKEAAQDLKNRLRSFEEDWVAEGMELYDKL